MEKFKIYVAGPDVFRKDYVEYQKETRGIFKEFNSRVTAHEFIPVFPSEANNLPEDGSKAKKIYEGNINIMGECDACVANMEDFSGVSTDVGTAFEMGYMKASGKPVAGYKKDTSTINNRKNDWGSWVFEDFDLQDNLMLVFSSEMPEDKLAKEMISALSYISIALHGLETPKERQQIKECY